MTRVVNNLVNRNCRGGGQIATLYTVSLRDATLAARP